MINPSMIMLVGLPGSGKSTFAKTITYSGDISPEDTKPIIHSSDELRREMYGDSSIQGDNDALFNELHKRIIRDLKSGKNVVYDATNINKKQRIHFLNKLKDIDCYKDCIVMATKLDTCLKNNRNRTDRQIPDNVIHRMYLNYQPPHENEGFENIIYIFNDDLSDKTLGDFFKIANNFDQKNRHHNLTLGKHCAKAGEYIQNKRPDNFLLLIAALLHDVGKLSTQTKLNHKGKFDGDYHYYNHQNTGAYDSMFYTYNVGTGEDEDITYVANLIYYHMHPYMSWKQSDKSRKRDMDLLGEKLFNDVLLLHEADLYAH